MEFNITNLTDIERKALHTYLLRMVDQTESVVLDVCKEYMENMTEGQFKHSAVVEAVRDMYGEQIYWLNSLDYVGHYTSLDLEWYGTPDGEKNYFSEYMALHDVYEDMEQWLQLNVDDSVIEERYQEIVEWLQNDGIVRAELFPTLEYFRKNYGKK